MYNNNIQEVEKLTFEDFRALEIMIGQAVSDFLDIKHENLKSIQEEQELDPLMDQ